MNYWKRNTGKKGNFLPLKIQSLHPAVSENVLLQWWKCHVITVWSHCIGQTCLELIGPFDTPSVHSQLCRNTAVGRGPQHSVHLAELNFSQLNRGLLVFSLVVCLFTLVYDRLPGKGKIGGLLCKERKAATTYLRYEDVAGELRPQIWAAQWKLIYFWLPFQPKNGESFWGKKFSWELLSKQMLWCFCICNEIKIRSVCLFLFPFSLMLSFWHVKIKHLTYQVEY